MKYCDDYAALLDLYVDGELSPDEMARVQAHLDVCPGCRAYVDDALAIRAAFPGLDDAEVPAGFAGDVMSAIRAQAAPRQAKAAPQKQLSKLLLPLAACCAIVVLIRGAALGGGHKVESAPAAMDTAACTEAPAESEESWIDAQSDDVPAEPASGESRTIPEDSPVSNDIAEAPSAVASFKSSEYGNTLEAAQEPKAEDALYFATLFLPREAEALLADYTPFEETDASASYALPREAYEDLLARLSTVDFEETLTPDVDSDVFLVILDHSDSQRG